MEESAHMHLLRIFKDIPDPRMIGKIAHNLHDILVITVCAVICGLDHWTQIEDFANAHKTWFKSFLDLPNGIASHDTFGKIFSVLDPDEFEKRIQVWIHALVGSTTEGKHIAIDGKTLRKSFDKASNKSAIHMVNAYVHENHAVFGQLKVDDKSNEITAIPKLLEMLQLKEATVTIDAMGCQRKIAKQIIDKEGDYVFSLKGNQGTLEEDVQLFMDDLITKDTPESCDYFETTEKSHGRIDTRQYWSCWNVAWLRTRHNWPGLSSIVTAKSTRTMNGETSTECRYFISSHSGRQAQKVGTLIRNHWRVENSLHWTLDVSFNEDQCRVRIDNASENLSRVRRISLILLKNEKTCKLGIKSKRAKAGYDRGYLLKLLGFNAKNEMKST